MWITDVVDLPDELVAAQRDGRLVVFAGAGVSMGAPSSLPGFAELAERIAAGRTARREGEPLDQFLGRCERLGVEIQLRTREILNVSPSQPTALHRDLVALFGTPDRVRLVTTNFDPHFTSVATERHGPSAVAVYRAPALPLGAKAAGIIHVHGALDEPRHPLVLTDADFGRAYLTEGWATRFLLDLFLNNTICFIGFGHSDPTIRYLARALVPGTSRFALTPAGNDGPWTDLGVQPVRYPVREGDDHGALAEAVRAWAALAGMGALAHEHQIKELVTRPPPVEPRLADYVRSALIDPDKRTFFLRHARGVAWLQFAADAGVLDSLFGTDAADDQTLTPLANWLAECFMVEHPRELLSLLRAKGMRIGRLFWHTLAWRLALRDPRPTPEMLARWVTILVATRAPNWSTRWLSRVFDDCSPEAINAALLLFSHLIDPTIIVREPWGGDDGAEGTPRFLVEVVPSGDHHEIRNAWGKVLRPALPIWHQTIAAEVTASLTQAHLLLLNAGAASDGWDPLSYGRAAIEAHPQDAHASGMDVVIDAARDTLEFALRERPEVARAMITIWEGSGPPLLQRLAIHGRSETPDLVPKEELDRVLQRGWLKDVRLKHEVFRLLARAYAGADEPTRAAFLDRALAAMPPAEPSVDPEEQHTDEYERYNLLVWLRRAAPNSPTTQTRFAAEQAAHTDFGEREHPDLSHWSSGASWVHPISPATPEALIEKPAGQQLDWILNYDGPGNRLEGPDRQGLLLAVRDAVTTSFAWGWELSAALVGHRGPDRGLWTAIVDGWTAGMRDADQWERVLRLVHATLKIELQADRAVASLLEQALDEASKVPDALLSTVVEVAERLVARPDLKDGVVPKPPIDWLLLAINHTAGKAMLAWLRALGRTRAAAGEGWVGLSPADRGRLESVLSATGTSSERARTVIASQAHFLFGLDSDWWRAAVLPLFDWNADPTRAAQAWSGYLQWGRWNNALFTAMRPFYEQTYARVAAELPDLVDSFGGLIAGIALYGAEDPWQGGWLERFISGADTATRVAWVTHMSHDLRGLEPEAVERVWRRWLANFWKDRLTGVPQALSEGERQGIAEWVFGLEAVAADAVNLVERMPVPLPEHTTIFFQLVQDGLAARQPASMARFVRHLLKGGSRLAWECEQIDKLVRIFIAANGERGVLLDLCEAMARLGCPSAADLRGLVPG